MAPITPKPMAHEEAILRNSTIRDMGTFAVRLFAPYEEHLALLGKGLKVVDVLGHLGSHFSY
jgi:hypothetical protein